MVDVRDMLFQVFENFFVLEFRMVSISYGALHLIIVGVVFNLHVSIYEFFDWYISGALLFISNFNKKATVAKFCDFLWFTSYFGCYLLICSDYINFC